MSQNGGKKTRLFASANPQVPPSLSRFLLIQAIFLPPSGVLRAALREWVGSPVSFAGVMRVFCHRTLRYPLAFQFVSRCVFLGRETLARLLACEERPARKARKGQTLGVGPGFPTLVALGIRDCSA